MKILWAKARLCGIALSYEEARDAYRKFLESWRNADADLPMVQHVCSQTR